VSCVTLAGLLSGAGAAATARADTPPYEAEPINYSAATPRDPVATLKQAIEQGKTQLSPTPGHGYLDALLRELHIAPSSQVLVFSRTSFQRDDISPAKPRALYFNDDVYVGYVPAGDMIEIASTDPTLGTVFYAIGQRAPGEVSSATPGKLTRKTDLCLQCHGASMTRDIPGLLVRSVFADARGNPIGSAGSFLSTHESPLKERWGGWYVTGSTGGQAHMGNQRWTEAEGQEPKPLPTTVPAIVKDASAFIDTKPYPTPHSDVVALMVLEHQVEAHNRATRAAHGVLRALRDEKIINDAMGEPTKPGVHSDSTLGRIKSNCEPLVEYLLFAGETKLTAPVAGSSDFAKEFSARGPRDAKGRSLRDFDLQARLFKYPCSYLIYSKSITGLPADAKAYVYRRFHEILTGKDTSDAFAHLSAADRAAIAEILRDTHAELRAAWAAAKD
jgi:hypothetical protein